MSTARADAVPPALRIGPAKYTAKYQVWSKLRLMRVLAIPSKGAATTPSVRMARAVRKAWSAFCSRTGNSSSFPSSSLVVTIIRAISKATSSRDILSSSSFIFWSMSLGPTSPSTRSARFLARGISGSVSIS